MKALKQLYIAILVLVVGLILIPLFKTESTIQELQGLSARDIQFIESIGFVDNLDGSWTITISGLTGVSSNYYVFDFQPASNQGKITAMRISSATQLDILVDYNRIGLSGSFTIWGGDLT